MFKNDLLSSTGVMGFLGTSPQLETYVNMERDQNFGSCPMRLTWSQGHFSKSLASPGVTCPLNLRGHRELDGRLSPAVCILQRERSTEGYASCFFKGRSMVSKTWFIPEDDKLIKQKMKEPQAPPFQVTPRTRFSTGLNS